ncbi:interferon regulatory factor 3 isoform X3 [Misgurnus anguillicaudatus]|uniref:interferon regulatory factor 3 isoform X3 n=1 Tax=Misgurnus anguillicaudatus TaxID=75329 RepID=UPI002434C1FA|nr:interferon regulatory factor 3 isoform X3 [Misgurnus anguillicaudatus]
MAQTKPLFVPWLYQQIESEKYPGVCWKNEEKTKFCIPWKHALRQDSNSDDVRIFKAWAQTSAAGDGRINGDPSVWKRNFRSALRAKGFKMILDNKNDAADPHKVYLFPVDSRSVGSEGSQETDASQELYSADEDVFTSFVCHAEQQLYQETSSFTMESDTGIVHFPNQESHEPFSSAVGAFGGSEQTLHLEGTSVGDFSAAERMSDKATCYPDEEHVRNQAATSGTNETYFQIKVYYKGKMMLDQLLKNDAGFRLIYQESRDSSVMESALPVVKLPSPDSIQDQTQARHTRDILENLGGLELKKLDSVVWGHRWGKTRVYWGVCKHEKSQTARELSKNTPQVIYFFKDYISGMMEFLQKSSGPSPSYTLYFCLGEKWPDPKMKPWEKKLIMIEVVLTSLEILKTMALECGASSLQSMELQVSLEQMMELC